MKRLKIFLSLLLATTLPNPPAMAAHHGNVTASGGGFTLANYGDPSCDQPPSTYSGTVRYVDPINGNDSNNGLAPGVGHAWASIKTSNISAGDDIQLYSGSYGDFDIQDDVKSSYTRIAAVPGQTPVFTSFNMSGSQHWVVQGIKVQHNPGTPNFDELARIDSGSGAAKNIIIDSSEFSTADDGSAWGQTTWKNAIYYGFDIDEGTENSGTVKCIALSRNHFKWIRNNLGVTASYVLVTDNEFDNPGGDSMDFAGSYISLVRNYTHDQHGVDWDGVDDDRADHNDFIQHQIGHCPDFTLCTRSHIVIDGNRFIEATSASLNAPVEGGPEGLQGISSFNEDLDDVTVTNNVGASSASDLLDLREIHDGTIANNTMVNTIANGGGINVGLYSHEGDPLGDTGQYCACGTPSDNVHLWNNTSSNLGGEGPTTTITFDHNDVLVGGSFNYWPVGSGSPSFNSSSGTYGTANTIRTQALSSYFATYVFSTKSWDFHLGASSVGKAQGTTPAPNCIDGTARTTTPDEGAYC